MSESKQVKEADLEESIANLYNVSKDSIENIEWSESKGAGAEDGFTTQLVAVKGLAKIVGASKEYSFIVKLTPEIGFRAAMVKKTGMFEKEYLLYGFILPILSRERENKGLKKLPIPQCFYAHPDPDVLVMINL